MRVIEQIKAIPGMQRYRYLWMTIAFSVLWGQLPFCRNWPVMMIYAGFCVCAGFICIIRG